MLAGTVEGVLLPTAITFVVGFSLLFLIYYFTSPLYTEYGDGRSRLFYSLINSLYFSIALAILFVLLPWLSNAYGIIASLAAGVAVIIVSTSSQVYIVARLVRSGFLKVRQRRKK
jgi:hypothetical protein